MLDRHYHHNWPSDVHVSIKEERAATDESVRLLREMEQQARNEVIKAIRLDGNEFKGVVQVSEMHMTGEIAYRVAFELNGKRHLVEEIVDRSDTKETIAEKLVGALAKTLSREILISIMRHIERL